MTYILIVVSLMSSYYGYRQTGVSMQEFGSVEACRAAAEEIKRQNNDHATLRMSCMPKALKP